MLAVTSSLDEFAETSTHYGLYVADASVMPTIPCANTNLPTIMVAERIRAALPP
jgi:choline dehydrogenase-like flavoprotein